MAKGTEIDDIFSSSGGASTSKAAAAAASAAPVSTAKVKKDKKKRVADVPTGAVGDKKRKRAADSATTDESAKPPSDSAKKSKKSAVTVVSDPSADIESGPTMSKAKVAAAKGKEKATGKGASVAVKQQPPRSDDLDDFTNSKGNGRSRTEEGYAIYSEAELKLGQGAGDTPLCPFDCDCCF